MTIWRTPEGIYQDPESLRLYYIMDCRHITPVTVWRHVNEWEKVPVMGKGLSLACHACMRKDAQAHKEGL